MKTIVTIAIVLCCFCSARAQKVITALTNDARPRPIMFNLIVGDTTFSSDADGKLTIDIKSAGYKKRANQAVTFSFHFIADQNLYKVPDIFKAKPVTLNLASQMTSLIIKRRSDH